jgi:hypothetical protein
VTSSPVLPYVVSLKFPQRYPLVALAGGEDLTHVLHGALSCWLPVDPLPAQQQSDAGAAFVSQANVVGMSRHTPVVTASTVMSAAQSAHNS